MDIESVTSLPERIEVWIPDIDIVLLRPQPDMNAASVVARYILQRLRDAGVPVRLSTSDVGLPAWTGLEYGRITETRDDILGGRLYVWQRGRLRYREEEK